MLCYSNMLHSPSLLPSLPIAKGKPDGAALAALAHGVTGVPSHFHASQLIFKLKGSPQATFDFIPLGYTQPGFPQGLKLVIS